MSWQRLRAGVIAASGTSNPSVNEGGVAVDAHMVVLEDHRVAVLALRVDLRSGHLGSAQGSGGAVGIDDDLGVVLGVGEGVEGVGHSVEADGAGDEG